MLQVQEKKSKWPLMVSKRFLLPAATKILFCNKIQRDFSVAHIACNIVSATKQNMMIIFKIYTLHYKFTLTWRKFTHAWRKSVIIATENMDDKIKLLKVSYKDCVNSLFFLAFVESLFECSMIFFVFLWSLSSLIISSSSRKAAKAMVWSLLVIMKCIKTRGLL